MAIALAGIAWTVNTAIAEAPDLALNRPVTVSSTEVEGLEGSNAVDGDPATRWASLENHDPEWIVVDLGATLSLSEVVLKWEAAYATSYRIDVSADGMSWQQVYVTADGDGGTDTITLNTTGRYVRMYGTQRGTEWGYSLWAFEVYGQSSTSPNPTTSPAGAGDLALNRPVTVSSTEVDGLEVTTRSTVTPPPAGPPWKTTIQSGSLSTSARPRASGRSS